MQALGLLIRQATALGARCSVVKRCRLAGTAALGGGRAAAPVAAGAGGRAYSFRTSGGRGRGPRAPPPGLQEETGAFGGSNSSGSGSRRGRGPEQQQARQPLRQQRRRAVLGPPPPPGLQQPRWQKAEQQQQGKQQSQAPQRQQGQGLGGSPGNGHARAALTAAVAAEVAAFGDRTGSDDGVGSSRGNGSRAGPRGRNYTAGERASAAAAAPPAEPLAPAPTLPPRRAGVTDGRWDRQDELAVREALEDAEKLERQYKKLGGGEVILGRSQEELVALMASVGQAAYRGKQLRDAVMQGARSVHDVTTLSKDLRAQLAEKGVRTGRSVLHHEVSAPDGTRKFLLQLADGLVVETVGIPADGADRKRLTVCVSSQVGCPMRCTFCATGKGGFARNLLPHEIVDQVLTVQEQFGQRVSNVVFMGMGEPLLNLPSVMRAHEILNQDVGIGARHITISTVGVPNAIQRMGRLQLQSTLAVSIHAPNQALREQIVPSARAYPLAALMADCQEYFRLSGRRVTFEYTLLAGVNDQVSHAQELGALLRAHDLRSHVNVISWNPVDESEFQRPSRRAVQQFVSTLEAAGVPVSLRQTRGLEAAAACGQLRNMHQKTPLPEFAVPA